MTNELTTAKLRDPPKRICEEFLIDQPAQPDPNAKLHFRYAPGEEEGFIRALAQDLAGEARGELTQRARGEMPDHVVSSGKDVEQQNKARDEEDNADREHERVGGEGVWDVRGERKGGHRRDGSSVPQRGLAAPFPGAGALGVHERRHRTHP